MTESQLNEIEARASAASPGPWSKCTAHGGKCSCESLWSEPLGMPVAECNSIWGDGAPGTDTWIEYGDIGEDAKQANKTFIAAARSDVPALVAEIRRLQELARWEENARALLKLAIEFTLELSRLCPDRIHIEQLEKLNALDRECAGTSEHRANSPTAQSEKNLI